MFKAFNVVVMVAIVALVIFLGKLVGSVETLEERLQYKEPVIEQLTVSDSTKLNTALVEIKTSNYAETEGNIKYTYVPSYSHVYRNNGRPLLLESTLSIRNTDPQYAMRVHKVEYYDSNGKMLRSFVEKTVSLSQLSSLEFLKEKMNEKGGFGAFFVVLWSSDNPLAEPVIESVMIESSPHKQISFVSEGRTLPFKFKITHSSASSTH